MKSTIHDLRIRRMSEADVARVMEIAGGLESAPHWPREAFLRALDPEVMPKRIALVAESDNAVAGFAVAILLPPEAELELSRRLRRLSGREWRRGFLHRWQKSFARANSGSRAGGACVQCSGAGVLPAIGVCGNRPPRALLR